jgi:protein-tyrosine phosphatase
MVARKQEKMKILFVCLGNICRSPLAEAILKKMTRDAGYEDRFFIDSAGTAAYHRGDPADSRMKLCASFRGYKLTSLSRPVETNDFYTFDLLIGMDDENVRDLKRKAPDAASLARIHQMTEYAQNPSYHCVPDPYYGDAADFTLALDILEDACRGLMHTIFSSPDN